MIGFDYMHVIESSAGLTIGSLLARAIGYACSRQCSKPQVQQIDRDIEEENDHEDSSSGSNDEYEDSYLKAYEFNDDIRPIIHYSLHNNNQVVYKLVQLLNHICGINYIVL